MDEKLGERKKNIKKNLSSHRVWKLHDPRSARAPNSVAARATSSAKLR
jgi:hypothetical protein